MIIVSSKPNRKPEKSLLPGWLSQGFFNTNCEPELTKQKQQGSKPKSLKLEWEDKYLILLPGLLLESLGKVFTDLDVLPAVVRQVSGDLFALEPLSQGPVFVNEPVGPEPRDVAHLRQANAGLRRGRPLRGDRARRDGRHSAHKLMSRVRICCWRLLCPDVFNEMWRRSLHELTKRF